MPERRSAPVKVVVFQWPWWHAGPAALATRRPPPQTRHLCRKPCLIDEDQLRRIEVKPAVEPGTATLQDIWPILLQCMGGLFLNVQPRPRSQTLSALRPMGTARSSAASRSSISFSVISLRSSISPTMNTSCPSRLEPRRRPCGRAVLLPLSSSIKGDVESAKPSRVT